MVPMVLGNEAGEISGKLRRLLGGRRLNFRGNFRDTGFFGFFGPGRFRHHHQEKEPLGQERDLPSESHKLPPGVSVKA